MRKIFSTEINRCCSQMGRKKNIYTGSAKKLVKNLLINFEEPSVSSQTQRGFDLVT